MVDVVRVVAESVAHRVEQGDGDLARVAFARGVAGEGDHRRVRAVDIAPGREAGLQFIRIVHRPVSARVACADSRRRGATG